MSAERFDPQSHNAMFATIISQLEKQDESAKEWRDETKLVLSEIRAEVKKTNGRVTSLEGFKKSLKAKALGIAFGVSSISTALFWAFSNRSEIRAAILFFMAQK